MDDAIDMERSIRLPDPSKIRRSADSLNQYADSEKKAASAMRSSAKAADKLADAREKLGRSVATPIVVQSSGAGSGSGGGGGYTRARSGPASPRQSVRRDMIASGPNQRLQKAQANLQQLMANPKATSAQIADAIHGVRQSWNAVDRINNPKQPKQPAPKAPPKVKQPVPKAPPKVKQPSGPFSQLSRAQAMLRQVRADPNASPDMLQDALHGVNRAQKRVDGLAPQSFQQRLVKMLYSTRFGGGGGGGMGGMMPLLGKSLDVVSGGAGSEILAAAGPIGIAALAAEKAGEALYALAKNAAETGREFSELRNRTGSNSGDAAKLMVYGKAFGADFGAMAEGMNNRITSDPTAAAFASRFGVQNIAGPYGKLDTGKQLLQAIEGLRKISDREERLRTARALGIEGALPLTQVSNKTFRNIKQDAAVTAKIMDPQFEADAAEFNAAGGRVQVGWQNMTTALGKRFFPIVTPILNGIADTMESVAAFANGDLRSALSYKMSAENNFATGIVNIPTMSGRYGQDVGKNTFGIKPFSFAGFGGGDAANPTDMGTSAQTAATQANTIALSRLTSRIGGGERVDAARPSSLTGTQIAYSLAQGALHLGPF